MRTRFHLSLRAKGLIALVLLVMYGAVVGFLVGHERAKLLYFVHQVHQTHAGDGAAWAWTLLPRNAAPVDARQSDTLEAKRTERAGGPAGGEVFEPYGDLNNGAWATVSLTTFATVAFFGAILMLFSSRLASDIKRLEMRAAAIVSGHRGQPLAVTRSDEVGRLMRTINAMESELGVRERQQELARVQRFHREKMAAVGSLAAAVAHEVSNPINAISGIAQHTIEAVRAEEPLNKDALRCNAEMTLKQTERIASILRHLADLSAPRSPNPELLDLNELVSSTCGFIRYDKRFRQVSLAVDTDRELPPVRAVADHLTQVLMNLLINAADATADNAAAKPTIRVATQKLDDGVVLSVSDNGHGMDASVLARAFDESFTTKPAGIGRGIGLYLCKTLLAEVGGGIELESTLGVGTVATVRLPSPLERSTETRPTCLPCTS